MTPLLAAWLHDLDPFVFRLPDVAWLPEGVRWYGLSYLLGFVLAYALIRRVTRVGVSTLAPERVADLVVTLAVGVVIGGRLGYVIFYRPELFATFYEGPPWWGVLAINEGGMASHGGMIGAAIAALWFAYRHGHDPLHMLDFTAFGAPLGLGVGRIANFINGELIGRPAPASLPWAVKFPQEMADWPVQRVEQVMHDYLAQVNGVFLRGPWDFVHHITAKVQAGDPQTRAFIEPLLTPRHPSQIYAALLEGLAVFLVLLWLWRRPRKPGLVGAWFCIAYAVARIADEFFRRPDAHLMDEEFALLGITRGQWLSVLLLAVGVWGVWYARRRDRPAMGAWRRGPWTRTPAAHGVPHPDKSE